MAIIFESNNQDAYIMIYKIGNESSFYENGIDFTEYDRKEYESIANPEKKNQWLASRYWLKKISKQQHTLHLQKSPLGKPKITNHNSYFSISHSKEYIAIAWSDIKEVSIDIEVIQPKIQIIKHKYLHPNDFEQGDDMENLCLIWSAKETIYKYFHTKDLFSFKENIMIIEKNNSELSFKLTNSIPYSNHSIQYKIIDKLIATWIV